MTHDAVLSAFVLELQKQIAVETEALVSKPVDTLYQVGRLQGTIDGLKAAHELLYKVLGEQNV